MSVCRDPLRESGGCMGEEARRAEDWDWGWLLSRGRGGTERLELDTAATLEVEEDVGNRWRTLSLEVVQGQGKAWRVWTLNVLCRVQQTRPAHHCAEWGLNTDWVTVETKKWRVHVRQGESWLAFPPPLQKNGKEGAEFKGKQNNNIHRSLVFCSILRAVTMFFLSHLWYLGFSH